MKGETDLLVRAQETAGHALHLATLSSDPDAGATDGLESTPGLPRGSASQSVEDTFGTM